MAMLLVGDFAVHRCRANKRLRRLLPLAFGLSVLLWPRTTLCQQVPDASFASRAVLRGVDQSTTRGQKKKGIKGRYLEVHPGYSLTPYRGAIVILEPVEIASDKDRPVDDESVRTMANDMLREALRGANLFTSIASEPPLELPPDKPILRIRTHLTLQHGSQAMRFWVGMGAGKSKLHIRILLIDARTGEELGFYNGYGTGSGSWSFSGGGVQRMAHDDLEENYLKFGELLRAAM